MLSRKSGACLFGLAPLYQHAAKLHRQDGRRRIRRTRSPRMVPAGSPDSGEPGSLLLFTVTALRTLCQEGLLGVEGSNRIAKMASIDFPESSSEQFQARHHLFLCSRHV